MAAGLWVVRNGVLSRKGRADRSVVPNRASLVPGTYKPGPSTTGVLPGSTLTPYSGILTASTPGQVIENLDIDGYIRVQAANVTIRNCRVRGIAQSFTRTTSPATYGLIFAVHAAVSNLVVEDCSIICDYPSWGANGILGHDYTMRRCIVSSRGSDQFGVYNTNATTSPVNVVVEGCWAYGYDLFRPIQDHPEGTHNDVCQIQSGSNTRFTGNLLDGYWSPAGDALIDDVGGKNGGIGNVVYPDMTGYSVFMFTPGVGPVSNVVIDRNWIYGGITALNISDEKGRGPISGIQITNNKFDHGSRSGHQALITPGTYALTTISGNTFEDGAGTPDFTQFTST